MNNPDPWWAANLWYIGLGSEKGKYSINKLYFPTDAISNSSELIAQVTKLFEDFYPNYAVVESIFIPVLNEEFFPVKDGIVTTNSKVWWKCSDGPQLVQVEDHIGNIVLYPEIYQTKEPAYRIVYDD